MPVDIMEDHPFDLQAYEPPLSLWSLVEQHVSPYEQGEIKNMLGDSLIDQSLELHAEIDTLLEIWRDYRYETDDMKPAKILPEPPGLRDRLIQEIQFFVDNVKEKAEKHGMNPERVLQTKYNMDVIDYALESARSGRPGSALPCSAFSREGRDTPMITSPTGSDSLNNVMKSIAKLLKMIQETSNAGVWKHELLASFTSTLSEEIESMNDKLNFLKFEEVVQHLRSTLEEEIETLLRDIRFLYECIDDEAEFRAEKQGTLSREPTILDLQQERSKMEKGLLDNSMPAPKRNVSSKMITPIQKQGSTSSPRIRIRNLDSPPVPIISPEKVSPNRSQSPKTDNSPKHGPPSSKTKPMKALHNIKLINQTSNNESVHPSQCEKEGRHSPSDSQRKGGVVSFKGRRTVMTMKEGISGAQIVTLGMPSEQGITHAPSPPSALERPSSAQRFRKMVMECRDT